jgi:DNA-directed RNA polymerase specialized sigma24 family protein
MTRDTKTKCGAKAWSFPLSERRKQEVEKIVFNLPMDERAIVYLRYWLDMGLGQIAKTLGMELHDVCVAHENAVAILKRQLEKVRI